MNILGHAYVATRAVAGNRELLIAGALIPESSPFIPDNPFTWKEIHESGEKLLGFLDQNYPRKRDLALGVLSHGVKYGADGFRQELEKFAGSQKEELLKKIAVASNVSQKTATNLLHNCLGGGLDYWILKNNPDLIKEVQKTLEEVEIKEVSRLLAECFGKNFDRVEVMAKKLFQEIYQPEDLTSLEGLARTWLRQAERLPDVGRAGLAKTVGIIKLCADLLKNNWREFLDTVTESVKQNLLPFVRSRNRAGGRS